jgi:large subunit ribosomal protein L25
MRIFLVAIGLGLYLVVFRPMSSSLSLAARPREAFGRHVHALRRAGQVPAVVYGHRQAAISIPAEAKEIDRIWQRAGRTHLVDLRVEGQPLMRVLIRELQRSPRNGRPLHADFFAVNLLEKLTAEVPLVLTGDSPAVTDLKVGQLLQTMNTVKVECLPTDLPPQITVDVSGLGAVDDSITVGDLTLPQGVTLVSAEDSEVVVKVAPLRVREEAEEVAPEAAEAEPAGEAEASEE